MQLTIVGASGSVSGPVSPASSYLVQAPHEGRTFSLLLDLGPGSFGALYRYLDPAEVDAVALSHLHPDHCVDLCGLYVAGRYAPTAPWRRIPVYGPVGTPERLQRAYEVSGVCEPGLSIAEWFEHRVWAAEQTRRTLHRRRDPGGPPRGGVRAPGHRELRRRAAAWSTPATPAPPRCWPSSPGGSTCCCRRRRS